MQQALPPPPSCYRYNEVAIYTSRFIHIDQDCYIYIMICILKNIKYRLDWWTRLWTAGLSTKSQSALAQRFVFIVGLRLTRSVSGRSRLDASEKNKPLVPRVLFISIPLQLALQCTETTIKQLTDKLSLLTELRHNRLWTYSTFAIHRLTFSTTANTTNSYAVQPPGYSHGLASFRCCCRDCHPKLRGTRPCNL